MNALLLSLLVITLTVFQPRDSMIVMLVLRVLFAPTQTYYYSPRIAGDVKISLGNETRQFWHL